MTELPPGWAETALGHICERVEKHNPSDRPNEAFRYIDIGGIEHQRIVETKELLGRDAPSRARQIVRAGDTVLSTVRTYLRKTALVPDLLNGATASTGFCVLRPATGIESGLVFYRVIEPGFVAGLSALQTGSSYPAVRDRDVFGQRVILPPSNEQRRIVAAIEEQFPRLDAAEASLRRAKRGLGVMRRSVLVTSLRGSWPRVQIGEVAAVDAGPAFKSQLFRGPGEGVRLLRGDNIEPGRLRWKAARTWPESLLEGYEHLFIKESDLILAMDRPLVSAGLKLARVRKDDLPALLVQRVARIRPRADVLTPFLHVVLQLPEFIPHLLEDQTGTQLPHITLDGIRSFRIPVPNTDEQQRIVSEVERQLSLVDALSTAVDSALRRGSALRRSILERAFTGKLVPQDPFDEPASVLLERIAAERAAAPRRAGRSARSARV